MKRVEGGILNSNLRKAKDKNLIKKGKKPKCVANYEN